MDTVEHPELKRVKDSIGSAVAAFVNARIGHEYTADELVAHVRAQHPHIAPSSPCTVMRDMRQRKQINYELVSRRQSRYRALAR